MKYWVHYTCYLQYASGKNVDSVIDILDHAEVEIEKGLWCASGWWKASATQDDGTASLKTPKLHICSLTLKNGQLTKWKKPLVSKLVLNFDTMMNLVTINQSDIRLDY